MTEYDQQDLLERLKARNPAKLAEVDSSVDPQQRDEVLAAAKAGLDPERHRTGWLVPRLAAVGAMVAIVLAALLSLDGSDDSPAIGPEYAAAVVRVAEVNPRILLTAPGWEITHVEPLTPTSGETQFTDGDGGELAVTWYPARFYDEYREDRAAVGAGPVPIEVLGLDATMVSYDEMDFATMLPPQGNIFVEIRGRGGDEAAYRALLSDLVMVEVDEWLAAMPGDIVQPSAQDEVVDEMLEGVPLPPGFELDRLKRQAVLNAEGLSIKVSQEVACGWLDSWATADEASDEVGKARAVEAMRTADGWPFMDEAAVNRTSAKGILEFAGQIAGGQLDRSFGGVVTTSENGVSHEYGPTYAVILSCDSMEKRLVESP